MAADFAITLRAELGLRVEGRRGVDMAAAVADRAADVPAQPRTG